MAEGKYEFSGEEATEEEEQKLVAGDGCASQSGVRRGSDTARRVASRRQFVHRSDCSFARKAVAAPEHSASQSTMIIAAGATRSNLNIFVATCAGTYIFVAQLFPAKNFMLERCTAMLIGPVYRSLEIQDP